MVPNFCTWEAYLKTMLILSDSDGVLLSKFAQLYKYNLRHTPNLMDLQDKFHWLDLKLRPWEPEEVMIKKYFDVN